jgi:hypothetical protein
MADHNGTPEAITLQLMHLIATAESKDFHPPASQGKATPDRAWILKTYAECLECVRNPNARTGRP